MMLEVWVMGILVGGWLVEGVTWGALLGLVETVTSWPMGVLDPCVCSVCEDPLKCILYTCTLCKKVLLRQNDVKQCSDITWHARMVPIKKRRERWQETTSRGGDESCWENLCPPLVACKQVQLLWKIAWRCLKKLKIERPYDLRTPLLSI